jgi:hypothetical protein
MACYPLATTAEGPGPRVGHASLLVGNAFIVYGGDTKMDDSDVLDETLYLLNTCRSQNSQSRSLLTIYSYASMVKSRARRSKACWKIWTFPEHRWVKNLRIWWSSGGLLYE